VDAVRQEATMSTTTISPETPAAARTYTSLRAGWIPLAALCLAFFVEMVDNTLLSIALPTIGRDLGSGTTALQWVTGAYSLTFGACCSRPGRSPTGSDADACCWSGSRRSGC
jgi:hypothetical protein